MAALRTEAEAFFSSLPAEKRRAHHDGFIGYLAVGAENVGASAGTPSAPPDLVESLSLSGFQEAGQEWNWDEQKGAPWRDAPYARALPPALHRAAEEYWRGATALLRALMELSEVALDLPRGHFDASFARPGTLLRLAWYPPSPKTPEGQWRYVENTPTTTDSPSFSAPRSRLPSAEGSRSRCQTESGPPSRRPPARSRSTSVICWPGGRMTGGAQRLTESRRRRVASRNRGSRSSTSLGRTRTRSSSACRRASAATAPSRRCTRRSPRGSTSSSR